MITAKFRTFLDFGISRIAHDALKLRDLFALFLKKCHDFIIDAVAFDAAAAISQQDVFAIFRKLSVKSLFRCLFTKIILCRIGENEVFHVYHPFIFSLYCFIVLCIPNIIRNPC